MSQESTNQTNEQPKKNKTTLAGIMRLFRTPPFKTQITQPEGINLPVFPFHVWNEILFQLDVPSLLRLARVCKALNMISSDNALWRPLVFSTEVNSWSDTQVPHLYKHWEMQPRPNQTWKDVGQLWNVNHKEPVVEAIVWLEAQRKMMMNYFQGMLVQKDDKMFAVVELTENSLKIRPISSDSTPTSIIECDGTDIEPAELQDNTRVKVIGACPPYNGPVFDQYQVWKCVGKVGKLLNLYDVLGQNTRAGVVEIEDHGEKNVAFLHTAMIIRVADDYS